MSKRILFTVTNDLTYDQRMIRICTTLAQSYEILLIGRKRKSSVPLSPRTFQQKRLSCFFENGKAFYIEYNLRLWFFLLFKKCDAICAIDLDTIAPAFFITKIRGKKMIYDAHEYFTEVPEVIKRPLVKKIWTWLEKLIVPRLNYAYTVSQSIADIFKEKYGTPFEVIRNVPFRKDYKPDIDSSGKRIIIYQGALNEGRGLEEAILAMKWIENAQLWLVGEGDLSQKLRKLVKEHKLDDRVIFKGFVEPVYLDDLTRQATIGLNLLRNQGLSYYYSLANKAFDYIQMNVPAINMDFPEYQRLNEVYETSVLLKELEPRILADTINKLLESKELYNRLKKNCQQAARIFVWEKEAKKLFDFYKKVFENI